MELILITQELLIAQNVHVILLPLREGLTFVEVVELINMQMRIELIVLQISQEFIIKNIISF
jgi:hypothetical protein